MNITNFTNDQLSQELKERGFTVLTAEQHEEVQQDIEGGLVLVNLIDALSNAITTCNARLQTFITQALIFAALDVEMDLIPTTEENVA